MTQQIINVGTGELAGDGESLRSAFVKVNTNFTELYNKGEDYDQSLNTTSSVQFANLTVTNNTILNGLVSVNSSTTFNSAKLKFNQNNLNTSIEIYNTSTNGLDTSSIRFFRQRGNLNLQINQAIGVLQFDGYNPSTGYASDYNIERVFPGMRVEAGAPWSATNNPTQIRFLNRVPTVNTSLPFPFNQTAANSTDTTVIENLFLSHNFTSLHTLRLYGHDAYQGWETLNPNPLAQVAQTGVFGTQRITVSQANAGNLFDVRYASAYSTSTNEFTGGTQYITLRVRTDHIPYWTQSVGGLNTSTQGQVNWVAGSTSSWSNNNRGPSIVKGAALNLNGTRYERLTNTVNYGGSTITASALWNTSTQAGDVLGTISFQGGLSGAAISNVYDGGVDGIILRAYAVNNWQGDQGSTTTDVTYSNNVSALRIEHATTTTIGGASPATGGLQQTYQTVAEFSKTITTFYTDVMVRGNMDFSLADGGSAASGMRILASLDGGYA